VTAKVQKIKKELRRLRTLTHSIEATLRMKELHERRLEALSKVQSTPEVLSEKTRLKRLISSASIERESSEASALELKYMTAINSLEPIDKAILLDGYINGKPYWKIGRDIGYSEDGVKKRARLALVKLAENL